MGQLTQTWAARLRKSALVLSGAEFTTKELGDAFGVGQRKLTHALRQLREEGLIVSHRPPGADALIHKLKPETPNWLCLPWRKHSNEALGCTSDRLGMACMDAPAYQELQVFNCRKRDV